MDNNDQTIQSYNDRYAEFVVNTPQTVLPYVKDFIDRALSLTPPGGNILEVGSASGRDAAYISSQGYRITPSDAVDGFLAVMKEKGLDPIRLDVLQDEIPGKYDLIYACAVLLHFTEEQTEQILIKMKHALRSKGHIAVVVKEGNYEGFITDKESVNAPRYYRYWGSEEFKQCIHSLGFKEDYWANGVLNVKGDTLIHAIISPGHD